MKDLALFTLASLVISGAAAAAPPSDSSGLYGRVAHRPLPTHKARARRPHVTSAESISAHPPLKRAMSIGGKDLASSDGEPGAQQVYAWRDGALYRLDTAPEEVSDIALQPGEALVSVAAGDTARWIIGDTTSGSGSSRRSHVLVKPSAAGLRTNLLIATDRRVYHLELSSNARAATLSIAWTYPDDSLLALNAPAVPAGQPVASAVGLDELDFNYRIDGDRPPWRPVRAFDDGRQVFIEFPPTLAEGEAPPLFVIGEDGKPELVNYRLRGRYYVVDRLFSAAELRLGQKHQLVVRIVRDGSRRQRSAS